MKFVAYLIVIMIILVIIEFIIGEILLRKKRTLENTILQLQYKKYLLLNHKDNNKEEIENDSNKRESE